MASFHPIDKYDAPRLLAGQDNRRFHVMIKPVGSTCNLDCTYCFYLSKTTLPDGPGAGRMSDETLERFVGQYIAGVTGPEVVGDAVFSRTQVKFGYAKNENLPEYCRQCPYLTDCWGECPKNRIIRTADGEPGLNYLCRGYKKFFAHATPEVTRMVADVRRRGVQPRARM